MKKHLTVLLSVAMLISLCSCAKNNTDQTQQPETVAENDWIEYAIKYDVKINPEFTVYADDDLCVTAITAENEDAEVVLTNLDVSGLSVNEAFERITAEAQAQGFMTKEKGNTVDINILEKDDEQMPTCHICGGCGTVICLECNGTGIACDCQRCGATGYIHFDAGPDCPHCGGSGVCSYCGGSGKIVVTNGEDGGVVYVEPGVAEMGVCPECFGNGVCANCHGGNYSEPAHDEVCEGCNGTGKLYCHDDLNGYRWCPCCWGSGIDGTGDPDYAQWLSDNGY